MSDKTILRYIGNWDNFQSQTWGTDYVEDGNGIYFTIYYFKVFNYDSICLVAFRGGISGCSHSLLGSGDTVLEVFNLYHLGFVMVWYSEDSLLDNYWSVRNYVCPGNLLSFEVL